MDSVPFNEFILVKDKFKDLCETYTEHAVDKDGLISIVDRMSDQPIFFLATPADEMIDFMLPFNQSDSQNSKTDASDICYDSSDSEDLVNIREDETKDRIYTLASEYTINNLITEYKKRKNQHSMPSKFKDKLTRKISSGSKRKDSSDSSVPEDIIIQRRNSIMKVSRTLNVHLEKFNVKSYFFSFVYFQHIKYTYYILLITSSFYLSHKENVNLC